MSTFSEGTPDPATWWSAVMVYWLVWPLLDSGTAARWREQLSQAAPDRFPRAGVDEMLRRLDVLAGQNLDSIAVVIDEPIQADAQSPSPVPDPSSSSAPDPLARPHLPVVEVAFRICESHADAADSPPGWLVRRLAWSLAGLRHEPECAGEALAQLGAWVGERPEILDVVAATLDMFAERTGQPYDPGAEPTPSRVARALRNENVSELYHALRYLASLPGDEDVEHRLMREMIVAWDAMRPDPTG